MDAVVPCCLVGGYQHFKGMYHLHLQSWWLQDYTALQPRELRMMSGGVWWQCVITCKVVLLAFVCCINYEIIKWKCFRSWILLLSLQVKKEEDRSPICGGPLLQLASDLFKSWPSSISFHVHIQLFHFKQSTITKTWKNRTQRLYSDYHFSICREISLLWMHLTHTFQNCIQASRITRNE